jgi:N-acetylmuramoyl-L-alanine amidase
MSRHPSCLALVATWVLWASSWAPGATVRARVAHPRIAPRPSSLHYTSFSTLAARLGASVELDELTGVHRLRRGERVAAVVPGVSWALVGSELRALDDEVVVRYGWAYVPRSLASRLERYFGRKPSERPVVEPVPPKPPTRQVVTVCIDPGHGGRDPGAISRWGLKEKDVVLPLSRMLASELGERGYEVVTTRDSDAFVELEQRPAMAERSGADLFVSIHANAMSKSSVHGIEIFSWDGRDGQGWSWRRRSSGRSRRLGSTCGACEARATGCCGSRGCLRRWSRWGS